MVYAAKDKLRFVFYGERLKIRGMMIAQEELQHLLSLPEQEKIRLAHRLLASLVQQPAPAPLPLATPAAAAPHPSAQWLLAMAGMYAGGPDDTTARADDNLSGGNQTTEWLYLKRGVAWRMSYLLDTRFAVAL